MGEEDSQWKAQGRPKCRGVEGYGVAGEDNVCMFWRRKRRQERLRPEGLRCQLRSWDFNPVIWDCFF